MAFAQAEWTTLALAAEKAPASATSSDDPMAPSRIPAASIILALSLLLVFLVVAVYVPRPSPRQLSVFRLLLSLAAAACGATVSSLFPLEMVPWKRVLLAAIGGSILFFLVFRTDPLGMTPGGERSGEKAEEGKRG
ncbi:MAG: hypothetical protein ACLFRG_07285 [Desulfococcaceae bacterium]